ncbi:MAG: tRNA (adenosine(37)-N6)-threonylcarbamoyltransferase complex transferase subunit TsaD [Candidatus Sumerlaeia bacterium]|nr:tRNA (adenosine(37)-N6)-threonylcarbamoyltransferase complex transferase subunit TsaD [Candidatus Sumerlaeia bacterium]
MRILGIETSCDETAAAVVQDGRRVLSNRVLSQIPLHEVYGGVVPEIASRAHVEAIIPMVRGAVEDAGMALADLDAVAVTRGPGLVGCLLVGMETAKALALALGKPLICVQHIAGHLYSPYLGRERDAWGAEVSAPPPPFEPYIGLVVSGGHSSVVLVEGPARFTVLGETLDDAVGEAYDKVAKHMGLGYPGGPLLDRLAQDGDPRSFAFPRSLLDRTGFDFSFSGVKTAVARAVDSMGGPQAVRADAVLLANICASFQAAAVDVLLDRAGRALRRHRLRRIAVTGGVACNRGLRAALRARLKDACIALPDPEFCTDNAAMIAGLAYHLAPQGGSPPTVNATASLALAGDWRGGA